MTGCESNDLEYFGHILQKGQSIGSKIDMGFHSLPLLDMNIEDKVIIMVVNGYLITMKDGFIQIEKKGFLLFMV